MKRTIIFLSAMLLSSLTGFANDGNLFSYDADQVSNELKQLAEIENYVLANPDVSLSIMQAQNNSLLADMSLSNSGTGLSSLGSEPPLGISSFLWGCCLGVWGILIVYLVAEDQVETKKALKGCIVGYLTGCVFYVAAYLLYFSYYGYYWY